MNKYIKLVIPILVSMVGILPMMGQETETGSGQKGTQAIKNPKERLLVIEIDPNNEITVVASTITSVSMHSFMLNGTMLVSEVTIDTTGNNSIRFYCVEEGDGNKALTSNNPQEVARQVTGRINKDIRSGGGKKSDNTPATSIKYPEGVYAHTIEFQLEDDACLKKIYSGARTVWSGNAPQIIEIKIKK